MSAGKNLQKQKVIGWKRLSSPSCESTTPNAKSKVSISKTKGFARSTWIKSGTIVKKIQSSESIFYLNSPWKRLILPSQMSKRSHYCKIMGNETSIKVGNPKKHWTSRIETRVVQLTMVWALKVHANVISKDDVVQESHFKLIEFTFLQLGIMSNFSKLLQHKMYMVFMIYHVLWEDQNVIDVSHHKIIQIFTKHIIHRVLENSRCIAKSKWHHNIFEMTITCSEFRLPFVTFLNMHQLVCPT